jgi:ribulose-phosphate 3-epimerase
MKIIHISPSILAADLLNLAQEIKKIEISKADSLHIDVMDNHFVPNLTFGPDLVKQIKKITDLPIITHLMIDPVDDMIVRFYNAGSDAIIIHPENNPNVFRSLQKIKDLNIQAGLAINPSTSFEFVKELIDFVDIVLIMTVNPGFAGQIFLPHPLKKIAQIKDLIGQNEKSTKIYVDGGINDITAKTAIDNGADGLIVGSWFFSNTNYESQVKILKNI